MEKLIHKYIAKLKKQGLADAKETFFLARDAALFSSRPVDDDTLQLAEILESMNIGSLLFSIPSEPYRSIVKEVVRRSGKSRRIVPQDSETRTFFHDISIVDDLSAEGITQALSVRKSAVAGSGAIVAYGSVTPEQAFVSFSSTCFSVFVKYFYDSLHYFEECSIDDRQPDNETVVAFNRIAGYVVRVNPVNPGSNSTFPSLMSGPPENERAVLGMLAEAGRAVVENRLVDSYFGNISYVYGDTLYISETGSSLDELEQCIDPVPLDGSSSVGITASSEFSTHKKIYQETGHKAILHGHPKFSVVMSMECAIKSCERKECHTSCREKRDIAGIPIVSGEIGTGPTGLVQTVPAAMKEGRGTIVYGHGVFTSGKDDFRKPLDMLVTIEAQSTGAYFEKVNRCLKRLNLPVVSWP